MTRGWRPSLGFVLGGALAGTLGLTFVGIIVFRYAGEQIGFRNAFYIVSGVIAASTAVLGWLLVRLLLRPIHGLETFAREVSQDPRSAAEPPRHFGTRELRRTARSVMEMAATLQNREATIRSYTDHVTHEIKSPVTAITAAVELLEDQEGLSASDIALIGQIRQATAKIDSQLEALRKAAKARETRYQGVTALGEVAAELCARFAGMEVRFVGVDVAIPISGEGLCDLLGHLLDNAAAHGATEVSITATTGPTITVFDNGPGISRGNAARIFDPFFTTRREVGGTGMGLSIVASILHLHGGSIRLEEGGAGATFVLHLKDADAR